jgi:hypothetical protein
MPPHSRVAHSALAFALTVGLVATVAYAVQRFDAATDSPPRQGDAADYSFLSASPDRTPVPMPLASDGGAPGCVLMQGIEHVRALDDAGALSPSSLFELTTIGFEPPELHIAFGAGKIILRDHAVARACPRPALVAIHAGKADVTSEAGQKLAVLTPLGIVGFFGRAKGRVRVATLGPETIVRVEMTEGLVWAMAPGARAELKEADASPTVRAEPFLTNTAGPDAQRVPEGQTLHLTRTRAEPPKPLGVRPPSELEACTRRWAAWADNQSEETGSAPGGEPMGRAEGKLLVECALRELSAEPIALP